MYELWNRDSRNLLGRYRTEKAALRDVLDSIRRYGSSSIDVLGLVSDDGRGGGEVIAEGVALADRALTLAPSLRRRSDPQDSLPLASDRSSKNFRADMNGEVSPSNGDVEKLGSVRQASR